MRIGLIFVSAIAMVYFNVSLVNSTWILKIGNGFDTLKFQKNNHVKIYDCEMQYTFHGSYTVSKDTLTIIEKDDSHSEDNAKVMFFRMKYLMRKNALFPVRSSQLTKGKWVELKMEFDKTSFFKRVQN